ncbi:hypothetical protein D3871_25170 [Noviherbaspirillum saxi]|uniref:Uncharacterized protein n=1 Tax=Noviherbaspirillum saxi TaxID=2320863 RepID=A0A3A3FY05_9BURK|nr:hypothetical protein D3871_25170 [Noviherbaspirillum saxi]
MTSNTGIEAVTIRDHLPAAARPKTAHRGQKVKMPGFAYATPPKPAPTLRARGMRLRLHVGPNAFGNALGNSIAYGDWGGSQQESALTSFRQAEIAR